MAILIEDAQVERLAEQLASAEGVSVAEVVRESLFSLANLRGVTTRKPDLRERLAALAREVDAVPCCPTNARSDNELLGYNEHGTW
ncbi:MAG TPA: type II toxin-antitoxin system VapB family antitoxin [Candidatus Angelobacter sp.]|jgi:hypothetical protein|nr:type II toxin-antitoxin system VapB family antitoxin [Candidatus Angelobacter sp.]